MGQLSAWYALSAIGFAQVCPSDNKYYINTPLFKSITLSLDEKYHKRTISDKIRIECDKDPLSFPYIKEVFLNGERINVPFLTYEQITSGGVVNFTLSDKPESSFGE